MSVLQVFTFCILVGGVTVVILVMKRKAKTKPGFVEIVKNPKCWTDLNKATREVDAVAQEAKNWTDDEVTKLARQFILEATSTRNAWKESQILKKLGERTHAPVLELLRDKNLYDRLIKPAEKGTLPEAPFNRACDLLGNAPPAEAVEVLEPFVDVSYKEVRKSAMLAIAKTGAPSISPLIRRAFADTDPYVRSYALMGLQFALNRAGLASNIQDELFNDVLALLKDNKNADHAADVLFRFNADKAKEFFLSQEVIRVDSPILYHVLKVFADKKASFPREQLIQLIASLEVGELKYPRDYALGEALCLLGQQQREEDRNGLHAFLSHTNKHVAEGAAYGLLCSSGLAGFRQRVWEAEKRSGFEALNEKQRFYLAVVNCDAEINNGGLAQYFVNSGGNNWREALAGFKEMGFEERLNILNEAIVIFGDSGPSAHRSDRQVQLSELYKINDGIFKELDARYYKSSELVDVFVYRFVINNAESFR